MRNQAVKTQHGYVFRALPCCTLAEKQLEASTTWALNGKI